MTYLSQTSVELLYPQHHRDPTFSPESLDAGLQRYFSVLSNSKIAYINLLLIKMSLGT